MRKKKEALVPLTPDEIPVEVLAEMIEQGLFQEEIPFEVLVEYYPELLNEWYPGFPSLPRQVREGDPVPCCGRVHNGLLRITDFPEIIEVALDGEERPKDGEYDLFLQRDEQGDWFVCAACEVEEDEDEEMLKALHILV